MKSSLLKQFVFYAILIAAWQALAYLKVWPPYLFPTPKSVLDALIAGFTDHSFWIAILVSMRRLLVGYAISVVIGMALGLGLAGSKFLEDTLGRLIFGLQTLPSICWLPLAVLWFGLSEKAILFVVLMGSLLSVTISMESGRKSIPRIYSMAGRNLGASGPRLFFLVLLPASLPFIISGLKQGWAFAWRSLISGEMLFVSLGLGQLLMLGRDLNDMSQVIAVMILIIIVGFIADIVLFRGAERWIQRRWGFSAAS
jgi:NitT/TauT family transport system permease protein